MAGWVIDALWTFVRTGQKLHPKSWAMVARYADQTVRHWREPDSGLWEVRDRTRHYLHSKVWAWIALDRAVRMAEMLDLAPLAAALKKISAEDRRALLLGLERLAAAAPASNR